MLEAQFCSNPDCQVAENGSCLQGHDPVKSCPNFGKPAETISPVESIEHVSEQGQEILPRTMVQLPTGQSFTQSDVDTFLLQKPAHLVAIVGDTSSGKSTLICSIYDKFLRGHFADRTFVGSATLMAFEEVAHYSRAASGATEPDTQRTSLSQGLQFFHLATTPRDGNGIRSDLFFSDRAGESYRAGLDRPNDLPALQELRLARTVAILVDGARLIQADEQHEVLDSTRQLVRAMMDSGTLSSSQHLQLVLTKRDEVERAGSADQSVARVQAVTDRVSKDFGDALASVSFFEVAARDPQNNFDPAYGCDALFQSWHIAPDPRPCRVRQVKKIKTQFDLLAMNPRFGEAS